MFRTPGRHGAMGDREVPANLQLGTKISINSQACFSLAFNPPTTLGCEDTVGMGTK